MTNKNTQKDIEVEGSNNKIIGGNDNSITHNYNGQKGKLGSLFFSLKVQFENPDNIEEIRTISESLSRYLNPKDTIGLEKKLENAQKSHLEEDFLELKQLFHKKLLKYQNYEPAQEIFTFLLAIVLERYRNIIKPMIRENYSEREILLAISEKITSPIITLLIQEGNEDIMGLNAEDIEGMYHYLTGNCHINWLL